MYLCHERQVESTLRRFLPKAMQQCHAVFFPRMAGVVQFYKMLTALSCGLRAENGRNGLVLLKVVSINRFVPFSPKVSIILITSYLSGSCVNYPLQVPF